MKFLFDKDHLVVVCTPRMATGCKDSVFHIYEIHYPKKDDESVEFQEIRSFQEISDYAFYQNGQIISATIFGKLT